MILTALVSMLAVLLPVQAFATSSSDETADVSASCEAITIDLSGYDWTEGSDAVEEQSHLEYRFKRTDTVTDVSEDDKPGYLADGYVETDATKHVTQPATDPTTERETTTADTPPSGDGWQPADPPRTTVSEAVVETHYEYVNKGGNDPTYYPDGGAPNDNWTKTGATKTVEVTPAVYAYHWVRTIPGTDEVAHYTYTMSKTVTTDWIHEDQAGDYPAPWTELESKKVVDVAGSPAVDESLNDLELTVDGASVLAEQFRASHSTSHAIPADTDAYDYAVRVNGETVDSGSIDCTEQTDPAEGDDGAVVDGKVKVCKYVGPPGERERLAPGQNPREVSENSVPDSVTRPIQVGDEWADAHGNSVVVAWGTDDCGATPTYDIELVKDWEVGNDPDQLFDEGSADAELSIEETGPYNDGDTVTVVEGDFDTGDGRCTVSDTGGTGEVTVEGGTADDQGVITHTVTNTVDCDPIEYTVELVKEWSVNSDPDDVFNEDLASADLSLAEDGPYLDGDTVTVEESGFETGNDLCTVTDTDGLGALTIDRGEANPDNVITHTVTNSVECDEIPTGSVTIAKQWDRDEVAAEEDLSPQAEFTVRIDGQVEDEPAHPGKVYEDLPMGTLVEVIDEDVSGLPDWCSSSTDLNGAAWTLTESAPAGTITIVNDITCEPLLDIELEKQWDVDSDPDGIFDPQAASSTLVADPDTGHDGDEFTVAETNVNLGSPLANELCVVIGKDGNQGTIDADQAVDGTYTHTHTSTVRCESVPRVDIDLAKVWVDADGEWTQAPDDLGGWQLTLTSEDDTTSLPGDSVATLKEGTGYAVSETGLPEGWQPMEACPEGVTTEMSAGSQGLGEGFTAAQDTTHVVCNQAEPTYEVDLVKEWVTVGDLIGEDGDGLPGLPGVPSIPPMVGSSFFEQLEEIAPLLSALVPTLDGIGDLADLFSQGFDPSQAEATLEGSSESGRDLDALLAGDTYTVSEPDSSTGSDRCHVLWTDGVSDDNQDVPVLQEHSDDLPWPPGDGFTFTPEDAVDGVITHTVTNYVVCVPELDEPTIEIDKEADTDAVIIDGEETVRFTVTITNPGPYLIDDLTLTDQVAGETEEDLSELLAAELPEGVLAAGESVTVTYDHTVTEADATESDELINTARVEGEVVGSCDWPADDQVRDQEQDVELTYATDCPEIGVEDSDTETVGLSVDEPTTPVERPTIDIDLAKTASVDAVVLTSPDDTVDIEYEYVITNDGEHRLRDLTLDDDVLGDLGDHLDAELDGTTLDAGDSVTVTVAQTVDEDDVGTLVNVAETTGRYRGRTVDAEASATVEIVYDETTDPTEEPSEPQEPEDPQDPEEPQDPEQPDEPTDPEGGDDETGDPDEDADPQVTAPVDGDQSDDDVAVLGTQVERSDGDRLPRTGTDLLLAALLALASAGLGGGLLWTTRRDRPVDG